jgi:hypothetical protein
MDKWSDEQLKKMRVGHASTSLPLMNTTEWDQLGGNEAFKNFIEGYGPDGGYSRGMGMQEKYNSWAATQYREKVRHAQLHRYIMFLYNISSWLLVRIHPKLGHPHLHHLPRHPGPLPLKPLVNPELRDLAVEGSPIIRTTSQRGDNLRMVQVRGMKHSLNVWDLLTRPDLRTSLPRKVVDMLDSDPHLNRIYLTILAPIRITIPATPLLAIPSPPSKNCRQIP